MFWRAVLKGFRFVRHAFKEGTFVAPHPSTRVQNAFVVKPFHGQVQPVSFRESFFAVFFAHWLHNALRVARPKCTGTPLQRMVANRRNPTPLFLAFVGFTCMGVQKNEMVRSATCSPKEELLHSWLQDMLQRTVENIPVKSVKHIGTKLEEDKIGERLGKASCNSAVYVYNNQYAVKMFFNYNAVSQSESLKKAFSKELTVLSSNRELAEVKDTSKYTILPSHPNVMEILGHFPDNTPMLPDAIESYPAALPSRLYPNGYGRNRTLFTIMRRFSGTLQEYTEKNKDNLSIQNSLALLTQLLEGLLHLNKNGVAHRDLKSDNILVNESANEMPHLVITDFDCCLAEKRIGLQMPYETGETSKGGSTLLMAPEVISAEPGPGKKIDYSKADEWAAGALAYEIFGQKHPFQNRNVDKESFDVDDLPELKGVPEAVRVLVKGLLQRHPNDRPDISLAATACQMLLWAPDLCMVNDQRRCLLDDVKRWFERMTLTLTLEIWKYQNQEDIPVEKQILLSFLRRTNVDEIMEAITWLHGVKMNHDTTN